MNEGAKHSMTHISNFLSLHKSKLLNKMLTTNQTVSNVIETKDLLKGKHKITEVHLEFLKIPD